MKPFRDILQGVGGVLLLTTAMIVTANPLWILAWLGLSALLLWMGGAFARQNQDERYRDIKHLQQGQRQQ